MLIIRDMLFFRKSSYGEFMASPENISTNILAARLKQLENNQLIERLRSTEDRKKTVYVLSQKGIELGPLLAEMMLWALDNSPVAPAIPQSFITTLRADRDKAIKPLVEEYLQRKKNLLENATPA